MKDQARLKRLAQIATLVKETAMADLRRANQRLATAETQLEQMSKIPDLPQDMDALAGARSQIRYEIWAEARRQDLRCAITHFRQDQEAARGGAAQAFGRDLALQRILARDQT